MDLQNANWKTDKNVLLDYLKSISSSKYRDFSKGLIPGEFEMLGVNLPTLKKMAKEIAKGNYDEFLEMDDDGIFELKFLKGQVIANIKDIDEYVERLNWYLPYITDWSLCDSFIAASKVIKKYRERFFEIAKSLIADEDEFKNRVGFVILLDYYGDEEYYDRIISLIDEYTSDKYYANMALAWLLSVLYVKFPEETLEVLKKGTVGEDVLKYTVRKIRDSYRVSKENKDKLKEVV